MERFNEQLMILQEQVDKKARLTSILNHLKNQQSELAYKVEELDRARYQEQFDVEELEGRSLKNYFYTIVGRKDDMLIKEKEEAYAAAVKYDSAASELKAVEEEIKKITKELACANSAQQQYDRIMAKKLVALKASNLPEANEIMKLEESLSKLRGQEREIKEAINAGNTARHTAEDIMKSLESAEGFGTWDLLGGGFVSDLAKHSHLDDAQSSVEKLQIQLRRFKTELSDVEISAEMQVNIDGFLRFADYFFDGLFADWTVLKRIENSKEQVSKTVNQLKSAISQLESMQRSNSAQQNRTHAAIKNLTKSAEL